MQHIKFGPIQLLKSLCKSVQKPSKINLLFRYICTMLPNTLEMPSQMQQINLLSIEMVDQHHGSDIKAYEDNVIFSTLRFSK